MASSKGSDLSGWVWYALDPPHYDHATEAEPMTITQFMDWLKVVRSPPNDECLVANGENQVIFDDRLRKGRSAGRGRLIVAVRQ